VTNPANKALAATTLALRGEWFHAPGLPAETITLQPGEIFTFTISYRPETAGIHRAELELNQRIFLLEGFAPHPSYPVPQLVLDPPTVSSGEQAGVLVRLPTPSPADGEGTVRMEFSPAVEGAGDDPAVLFVASGHRTIPFTVAAGALEARFGEAARALYQTGTTAGTIRLTVELGNHVKEASVVVPPVPVQVDTATTEKTATGLDLTIAGFDNTQSARQVTFLFFDRQGRQLTAAPMKVDVAGLFGGYYSLHSVGGVFSLMARFPVAGDVTRLSHVEVEFANNAGTSAKRRIEIR
jgi:hypothetical protein